MRRVNARILAIAPVSRGFGLVVMDDAGRLLDWRVREIHEPAKRKNARCVFEIDKLIKAYQPQILVLEDHRAPGAKKRKRVRQLLDATTELAADSDIGVAAYGPRDVRSHFGLVRSARKDVVATAVAKQLHILRTRVPSQKRIWQSERYAMSIFTAAALALTHRGRAQRKDALLP